jgi:hypothetical protein
MRGDALPPFEAPKKADPPAPPVEAGPTEASAAPPRPEPLGPAPSPSPAA